MFTASHNPAQYNGIKLCLAGARPVGEDSGLAEIKAMAAEGVPGHGPSPGVERSTSCAPSPTTSAPSSTWALRPLKVVADTANGMGGLVVPAVFAGLPFDLEVLYGELDGTFPNHPADPIQPENLRDLQARVLEVGADVGLAFDGDADRVFLVDETGEPAVRARPRRPSSRPACSRSSPAPRSSTTASARRRCPRSCASEAARRSAPRWGTASSRR